MYAVRSLHWGTQRPATKVALASQAEVACHNFPDNANADLSTILSSALAQLPGGGVFRRLSEEVEAAAAERHGGVKVYQLQVSSLCLLSLLCTAEHKLFCPGMATLIDSMQHLQAHAVKASGCT